MPEGNQHGLLGAVCVLATAAIGFSIAYWLFAPRTASLNRGLISATLRGIRTEVHQFLAMGAAVNYQDENGCTALIYATKIGHTDIVALLLSSGADINFSDTEGYTPLVLAVLGRFKDIVLALLSRGVDVNKIDQFGCSALHYALVSYENNEIVTLLISYGKADMNIKNSAGSTPLILAVWQSFDDVVDLMLHSGADVSVRDNDNILVLDYVRTLRAFHRIHKEFKWHNRRQLLWLSTNMCTGNRNNIVNKLSPDVLRVCSDYLGITVSPNLLSAIVWWCVYNQTLTIIELDELLRLGADLNYRINVPPGHLPGQLLSPSAYEVAVMMGNEMMAQALVSRGASTLSVQLDEFNDGL